MASKKRRKRKRRAPAAQPTPVATAPAKAKQKPARRALDDRPPAPWGSFPLVEIAVLVGLVMLIIGFTAGGDRRTLFIATGLALGSVAGLELSVREHFAGYRSHSSLLAGTAALAVLAVLFYAGPDSLPPVARVAIAVVVFAGVFYLLAAAFRRRAGVAVKLR